MTGRVTAIFIAPVAAAPLQPVPSALLEAGRGIVGDRYFSSEGTFSGKLEVRGNADWEVTLIETEEIDDFNERFGCKFGYADFRRNIAMQGIRLNSFVGQQFFIGGARLEGIRLCEPCAHLAGLTDDRVLPGLVGRGGLRARIVSSGTVSVGDRVTIKATQPEELSDRFA